MEEDEEVSFELTKAQLVFVMEVTNRGEVKFIEKDVQAVKELFRRLEMQFPGQQVPDAMEVGVEIDSLVT